MEENECKKTISNRWKWTIGIIVLGIALSLSLSVLSTKELFLKENSLENLYFASQIISALFVCVGVLIAGWQYVITSKAELMAVNISQIQKAIDLSAFYKDNILKPYIAVQYVFERSGILRIMNEIRPEDMNAFDVFEMNQILPIVQQEKLKRLQHADVFVVAVMEANEIYGLNLRLQTKTSIKDKGGLNSQIAYDSNQIVSSFMNSIVTNMLNDMEYFALHFSHATADDSVVYQSLHQTYLEIVRTLYYNIARLNKPGQTFYYTNLIFLYKKWSAKYREQLQLIASGSRNSQCMGSSVQTNL